MKSNKSLTVAFPLWKLINRSFFKQSTYLSYDLHWCQASLRLRIQCDSRNPFLWMFPAASEKEEGTHARKIKFHKDREGAKCCPAVCCGGCSTLLDLVPLEHLAFAALTNTLIWLRTGIATFQNAVIYTMSKLDIFLSLAFSLW